MANKTKKINLKNDFSDKEKELLNIYTDMFNLNFENNKIINHHLIKHLYRICFILVIAIIIGGLL